MLNASNITALASNTPAIRTTDANGYVYSQQARVDGGNGIDTIRLIDGADLDLTRISQIAAGSPKLSSRISSIERIDMATDTSRNVLTIDIKDVLDMSDMNIFNTSKGWSQSAGTALIGPVTRHQMAITGTAADTVDLDLPNWSKVSGATVSNGGVSYDVWNHSSLTAQLLIQQGVIVS